MKNKTQSQKPAGRGTTTAPVVIYDVDVDIDITPEKSRVHPWRVSAEAGDFDTKALRGCYVELVQLTKDGRAVDLANVAWLNATHFSSRSDKAITFDIDGVVDINDLETFAECLLAVVTAARAKHFGAGTRSTAGE